MTCAFHKTNNVCLVRTCLRGFFLTGSLTIWILLFATFLFFKNLLTSTEMILLLSFN